MAITLVFANQKGGVGKTTSTVNIGAFLAEMSKKVLLIDFDPQGNLGSSISANSSLPDIYAVISGKTDALAAIQKSAIPGLDIIPASIHLSGASVELVTVERREFYLKTAIEPLSNLYDFILIDCPPSLGILTVNGLTAADRVLIPLQTEYFALEGMTQLVQNIRLIQQTTNPKLDIGGIIFTMYDSRTKLAQDVVQDVIGFFGNEVFKTIIPRNVRLSEAPSHGVPISVYDASCVGSRSYRALTQEVLERAESWTR